ncbi:hypothetical protein [Bradyrhizobium macuxiense]|uniref:hypothetical protein n=1 Tax=Bradyrhizobium macuxiense TaxID=1755647 RepID=UPI0013664B47|nr:hypothetical protein [Bradyrhizobium macuxiense]
MNKLQLALVLLGRFGRGEFSQPSEGQNMLEARGCPVTEKGFVGSENTLLEVDC